MVPFSASIAPRRRRTRAGAGARAGSTRRCAWRPGCRRSGPCRARLPWARRRARRWPRSRGSSGRGPRPRAPIGLLLAAHVHHPRTPGRVQMGEALFVRHGRNVTRGVDASAGATSARTNHDAEPTPDPPTGHLRPHRGQELSTRWSSLHRRSMGSERFRASGPMAVGPPTHSATRSLSHRPTGQSKSMRITTGTSRLTQSCLNPIAAARGTIRWKQTSSDAAADESYVCTRTGRSRMSRLPLPEPQRTHRDRRVPELGRATAATSSDRCPTQRRRSSSRPRSSQEA